jgi:hypothetical protein
VFDLVDHPRDGTGRFLDSGSPRDPRLVRLERRLAAAERRLRVWAPDPARRVIPASAEPIVRPTAGPS